MEKRKTYTSTAVKRKYNAKTYRDVRAAIRKELVEEWEKAIKEDNISKAEFMRRAMVQYLDSRN